MYVKSPFNYIGNKYRILDQIIPRFSKNINTFVDLFCGGCDVVANVKANKRIANDINDHLIDVLKSFQEYDIQQILNYIHHTIAEFGLSETNPDSYNAFRDHYNKTRNPMDLFILSCFSFSNQIRFNNDHEFNCSFGFRRFNNHTRFNLENFVKMIKDIEFSISDFRNVDLGSLQYGDFVYADPPYIITTGTYNDGKRGFDGLTDDHESDLYDLLSNLSARGIKFALSNVTDHKGLSNDILKNWIDRENLYVYNIDIDYDGCNYQSHGNEDITREVLVTNYECDNSAFIKPIKRSLFDA